MIELLGAKFNQIIKRWVMTLWIGFLLWALAFHALGWYLTGFNVYAFGTGIMFAYLMSEFRDWYRDAIK